MSLMRMWGVMWLMRMRLHVLSIEMSRRVASARLTTRMIVEIVMMSINTSFGIITSVVML